VRRTIFGTSLARRQRTSENSVNAKFAELPFHDVE
jgi:hypothetical protein